MNFRGRPLSHLPGRVMVRAAARLERVWLAVSGRYPGVLGLPVQGPFVQLYRNDAAFTTELSVFNYLSTFLPDLDSSMQYEVVAFAADGKKLGEGRIDLRFGQTAQRDLASIIAAPLDRYGMFHVLARAHSADAAAVAAVGPTSGQFMTLFYPRQRAAHAPQLLHSHKPLQAYPVLFSPTLRHPHVTEAVAGLEGLQFFFLNPNPLSLTVTLAVMDAMNGAPVAEQVLRIVGRGTGEFAFARDTLAQWPQTVSFAYRFDRQVSHMKPILFRSFAGGVVTCNHT